MASVVETLGRNEIHDRVWRFSMDLMALHGNQSGSVAVGLHPVLYDQIADPDLWSCLSTGGFLRELIDDGTSRRFRPNSYVRFQPDPSGLRELTIEAYREMVND